MRLSIIVPILNEAAIVRRFLQLLRAAAPDAEIIVADGGSQDESVARARALADIVITSDKGRGRQMNSGASVARGELLWFLHADAIISREAVNELQDFMRDPANAGGCFSLRIVPTRWIYRFRDAMGNRCVDWFGIALGDRGLFCRRSAFEQVGHFTSERLFEDANLYRSLRGVGITRRLRANISTSSRRYEAQGPIRTCLFYGFVMLLYWFGVNQKILERLVFGFVSNSDAGKIKVSKDLARTATARPVLRQRSSLPFKPHLRKIHP